MTRGGSDEKGIRFQPCPAQPVCHAAHAVGTIRLEDRTIEYFQGLSAELEVPYQTLINLYLRDCAETGRRPAMRWRPAPKKGAA